MLVKSVYGIVEASGRAGPGRILNRTCRIGAGPAGKVAGTSVNSQEEDFGARRRVRRSVN